MAKRLQAVSAEGDSWRFAAGLPGSPIGLVAHGQDSNGLRISIGGSGHVSQGICL